jgi:hypothetical protein
MKAGRWAFSGPLDDVGKVFHYMMITAAAGLSRWDNEGGAARDGLPA